MSSEKNIKTKKEEEKYIDPKKIPSMTREAIEKMVKERKAMEKKYPPINWYSLIGDMFSSNELVFSYIIGRLKLVASNSVPIAGVTFSPAMKKFIFLYNDLEMRRIYKENGVAVVRGIFKHEVYHILLGHLDARKPKDDNFNKVWNYAADLAINSNLSDEECPEFALLPGRDKFASFPKGKTSEWYFYKILEEMPELAEGDGEGEGDGSGQSSSGSGGFSMDDVIASHDLWESMNGELDKLSEEAKDFMKQKQKEAAKELTEAGLIQDIERGDERYYGGRGMPGNIPYNTYKEILEGQDIAKFNIKELINKLTTSAIVSRKRKSSRKIYNKRFPKFSGVRRKAKVPHIVIAVDQSGSVSDDMVHMFFQVSKRLNKYFKITILPFDTRVNVGTIKTFEKGKFSGKHQRTCHGGTDFEEVIKYTNKNYHNVELIIVTDLEDTFPSVSSKNPVHWVASAYNIQHIYDKKFLDPRLADVYEVSTK